MLIKAYKKDSTIIEFYDDYCKDTNETTETLERISKKILNYLSRQKRCDLTDENK
ncbi:MAG TPA: hypothetical protein GXZ90_02685 [Clostridiales bacterium]|nr:hypothetical protein [Clostridiales bacterium]